MAETTKIDTSKIDIDGYCSDFASVPPPDAAVFGKGARTIEQINDAVEARYEYSKVLTNLDTEKNTNPKGRDVK